MDAIEHHYETLREFEQRTNVLMDAFHRAFDAANNLDAFDADAAAAVARAAAQVTRLTEEALVQCDALGALATRLQPGKDKDEADKLWRAADVARSYRRYFVFKGGFPDGYVKHLSTPFWSFDNGRVWDDGDALEVRVDNARRGGVMLQHETEYREYSARLTVPKACVVAVETRDDGSVVLTVFKDYTAESPLHTIVLGALKAAGRGRSMDELARACVLEPSARAAALQTLVESAVMSSVSVFHRLDAALAVVAAAQYWARHGVPIDDAALTARICRALNVCLDKALTVEQLRELVEEAKYDDSEDCYRIKHTYVARTCDGRLIVAAA